MLIIWSVVTIILNLHSKFENTSPRGDILTNRKRMIQELLSQYPPITLEQMHGVKLLNRIDTKYVTTVDKLADFLRIAKESYYAQDFYGKRLMPYHTIYLDTPELDMYYAHQSGKAHRYKVRMRRYENDGATFIEVKNKNNKGRTKKKRTEISDLRYERGEMQDFIAPLMPYDAEALRPTIENAFHRITLVNLEKTERLTIDVDLSFHNMLNDNRRNMPQHVIIELKRDGLIPSPAIDLLRQLRIKKCGFSKMALGMAMTSPDLKQNLFKQRLRYINNLTK